MKAIVLLVILLTGCATKPSPALVAKLARVSLKESAKQYALPQGDLDVRTLAKDNLDVCSTYAWLNLPISNGPASPEVGEAIEAALPFAMTTTDCAKALRAASRSIK